MDNQRACIQVSSNFQFCFFSVCPEERERNRGEGRGYHSQDSTAAAATTTLKPTKTYISAGPFISPISTVYHANEACFTRICLEVTPKRRPCRLQTAQTMQTEYFFSNTWLTFFGFAVKIVLNTSSRMFVIYSQTAQTRHLTVDSIDKRG